jgi:hypothetical protein
MNEKKEILRARKAEHSKSLPNVMASGRYSTSPSSTPGEAHNLAEVDFEAQGVAAMWLNAAAVTSQ